MYMYMRWTRAKRHTADSFFELVGSHQRSSAQFTSVEVLVEDTKHSGTMYIQEQVLTLESALMVSFSLMLTSPSSTL